MTIAIYLAHLNPVTNAHAEIIRDLSKTDKVVVMPVRFLNEEKEINSKSFPFSFELRKEMLESVLENQLQFHQIIHFMHLSKNIFHHLFPKVHGN